MTSIGTCKVCGQKHSKIRRCTNKNCGLWVCSRCAIDCGFRAWCCPRCMSRLEAVKEEKTTPRLGTMEHEPLVISEKGIQQGKMTPRLEKEIPEKATVEKETVTREVYLVICPSCKAKNLQGSLKCEKCGANL